MYSSLKLSVDIVGKADIFLRATFAAYCLTLFLVILVPTRMLPPPLIDHGSGSSARCSDLKNAYAPVPKLSHIQSVLAVNGNLHRPYESARP
jgi:hypothetical protein